MSIDIKATLVQSITQTVGVPCRKVSFQFDALGWTDDEVTVFIQAAHAITSAKSLQLKGVILGGDIASRLGSPQKVHGIPAAQVADVGSVELVFEA